MQRDQWVVECFESKKWQMKIAFLVNIKIVYQGKKYRGNISRKETERKRTRIFEIIIKEFRKEISWKVFPKILLFNTHTGTGPNKRTNGQTQVKK